MWNFLVVRCDNPRLGTVILRQDWHSTVVIESPKLYDQTHYSSKKHRQSWYTVDGSYKTDSICWTGRFSEDYEGNAEEKVGEEIDIGNLFATEVDWCLSQRTAHP